ncbi:MAG: hypothetical protein HC866_25395 [Leptolyngbyaceae cyanobacterium RU_5_1]|nr:hypothetical protein [Leptolyngbyaceae cyanobacterium RU_5_1]
MSEEQKTLVKQLETDFLPKIETILSPEQREKLSSAFSEGGASLRKAFKSLTLTPSQKSELSSLFKSLPKRDIFASLTPEQKKQLFVKNKELFMPTPQEISEKISRGMKMKGVSMPEGVSEKISAKMKSVGKFIPTPKEIGEKVSAGMKMMKSKVE